MNIFSVLAAVGMLSLAGACGVLLGYLEQHWMDRVDESDERGKHERHPR